MMAVEDHSPVWFTGQGHVFYVGFFALIRADGASYPSGLIKVELAHKICVHFMLPSDLRVNDLFLLAGTARRLLMTVVPPLLKGFL